MLESIHRYFMYHYPTMPGGGFTVCGIFLAMLVLWMMFRITRWGGWLAFFYSFAFYTVPMLTEYHHH